MGTLRAVAAFDQKWPLVFRNAPDRADAELGDPRIAASGFPFESRIGRSGGNQGGEAVSPRDPARQEVDDLAGRFHARPHDLEVRGQGLESTEDLETRGLGAIGQAIFGLENETLLEVTERRPQEDDQGQPGGYQEEAQELAGELSVNPRAGRRESAKH